MFMIDEYRQINGNSAKYEGDSYQNIIGDLIAVQGWRKFICSFLH